MRGYQLSDSAARWQHWSQKCFALIFSEKSQKVYSATAEAREKISTYLESIEFLKYMFD